MTKDLKFMKENRLTLTLSALFVAIMLVGCSGKETGNVGDSANAAEIETTGQSIQGVEAAAIEEVTNTTNEKVGNWNLSYSKSEWGVLANMFMDVQFSSYKITFNIEPENDLHSMLLNITFRKQGEDGKYIPMPGRFSVKIGDLKPIESEACIDWPRWNIDNSMAKDILKILDKGNFELVFQDMTDNQTYKLDIGTQTIDAEKAYERLLELYNQE